MVNRVFHRFPSELRFFIQDNEEVQGSNFYLVANNQKNKSRGRLNAIQLPNGIPLSSSIRLRVKYDSGIALIMRWFDNNETWEDDTKIDFQT